MPELFRLEAENQSELLTRGLLALERSEPSPQQLEALMRAAHSFKGAARIVNLTPAVQVAHAMEDCFVAAQQGTLKLQQEQIDVLLRGVDWLGELTLQTEATVAAWTQKNGSRLETWLQKVRRLIPAPAPNLSISTQPAPASDTDLYRPAEIQTPAVVQSPEGDRFLRLTAENLNRLLALAGESLVESRWLRPFAETMQRLKHLQMDLESSITALRHQTATEPVSEATRTRLFDLAGQAAEVREFLTGRLEDLDAYDRRAASLSNRLYLEVLRTRMRPFGDGVQRFPRMVRDLARTLGKQARLEIQGETTLVDRDILDRLEAPLTHLLRNAIDHGCETPEVRQQHGKPREAIIRLEARHSAGMLQIIVADDGAGLDSQRVREVIVQRHLTTAAMAEQMTEAELLQFLFLPGFSLRDQVTELSGRGVGLDVVQNMIKAVRGSVRVSTQPGQGMRFQLQLPLTLSVLRTLLVEIGGEPYAFPLAQIDHSLKLTRDRLETLEGRHHFRLGDQHIGLLSAHQILECPRLTPPETEWPVVVLGNPKHRYGLLVDRFLGERELVVQPLDPRLGKVRDISAAALLEDGAPVLIVDVDDMVRSIEKLITSGAISGVAEAALPTPALRKRVLVVDDSLTVRELERKLLEAAGYAADVAVDGMDAWNAARAQDYDLIITDVDMPRLDGIELTSLLKKDEHLRSIPVMIVSYKDRDEDRMRGLDAGADYYLTKGSFHDETLIRAVADLIGEAAP
jgi:two-component system sensor histidine kinase and response regulator WspE